MSSSPSISPDGTRLAFVRTVVDREQMEVRSQIMMMSLPNSGPDPFTHGNKDAAPRFSPDGLSIAFVRPDDKDRKQLWLLPTVGGEARRLTDLAGGVREHAWSPDSRRLAFVSDVDPDRLPEHDSGKGPRVRVVHRIRYRFDTLGWRGDAHPHLFVLDTVSVDVRQLTDGDWDDGVPAWSPDGKRIAFVSGRRDDRDLTLRNEAYVVSAEGGEPEEWSQELSSVVASAWSPDGSRLAALATDDDEIMPSWQGRIYVLEPGKEPRAVTDDTVSPVGGFPPVAPPPEIRWTGDGRILFVGDRRGQSYLFSASPEGGNLKTIAGGGLQYTDLSVDSTGSMAVAPGATPDSSGDLYLIDTNRHSTTRLTDFNREYFEEHATATLQKFHVRRSGKEIESRLLLPPGFDGSGPYPMVLDIHGGPNAAFHDAFNPVQQVLATAGYVVLAVNPRGSSGYGIDFMKAVLRDWGGEDYLDIMAAVDEASSREYIDESRLGVTGYSYGGYMTAWIVGHDTRFRAAVVGAPVIDLVSAYGTSDIGVAFGEVQWGGVPHTAMDTFLERSPLTYAPRVETPVLLLHGEEDRRCPISQSEEYFVSLKRLGKEVEFVRFPGCAHSMLRIGHPDMRAQYLRRTLDWFDRHLAATVTAPMQAEADVEA